MYNPNFDPDDAVRENPRDRIRQLAEYCPYVSGFAQIMRLQPLVPTDEIQMPEEEPRAKGGLEQRF